MCVCMSMCVCMCVSVCILELLEYSGHDFVLLGPPSAYH